MLKPFAPDIWIAEGPVVSAYLGFRYPTRMAVIRLPKTEESDGGLFIWSPVALTDELRAEVAALGPVAHIVAPNALHHLSIPEWARAFPDAKLHAAPGVREKRPETRFAADLTDAADPAWAGAMDQAVLPNAIATEIVFFHRASGTVFFTDALQQFSDDWFSGWRRWVAKADLMAGDEPHVPRKFRLAFRDKPAARAALARILSWPVQNVVMAHGEPVTSCETGDASAFLARAFSFLKV
ncbi:hypothetical protein FHS78_002706 [Parvibaculum indicum]|uniref:DUF4336 domain-containing protein n=1 Tax=Parvibaculum indicum TaxID=562969 RepID=UPI0014224742|nr:DUF4336 domain-containing protein [Parvibaculum indicum]NIJ42412.1 hypothetical protein [Parvibaculum indicum]